jgi:hypothetical protein
MLNRPELLKAQVGGTPRHVPCWGAAVSGGHAYDQDARAMPPSCTAAGPHYSPRTHNTTHRSSNFQIGSIAPTDQGCDASAALGHPDTGMCVRAPWTKVGIPGERVHHMFTFPRAGLGHALRTKVGIAVIAAVLVGGGGTALAMASTHTALPFAAGSPTAHSDQGDQDEQGCTSSATGTPSAHHDSDEGSDHESGTPSATRTASGGDEANEHESSQDDQDECGKSTTTRTPGPESTEQPEGTHSPTKGPGGD